MPRSRYRFAVLASTIAVVAALLSTVLTVAPASAATPAVTSTGVTLAAPTGSTPLTGVSISGYTNETLLVNVSTTIGTLSMSTTTGLTLTYGYSSFTGATLSFTGTQSDINAALATLRYNGNGSTGTAAIAINTTVNQSGISYFPTTGHYYQYVSASGGSWSSAASAATSHSFNGQTGYLASIPSAAVNSFIQGHLNGAQNVWAGGAATNLSGAIQRRWTWQGGPIAGTVFTQCTNASGTCTHSGDSGDYYDWNSGEPNNYNSSETDLEINYQGNGTWNDLNNTNSETSGYVVEYGDQVTGGNFTSVYSASSNVTVAAAPGAPTAVMATRGDTKATVSWTPPASNGGSTISGYTVTPYAGGSAQTPVVFSTSATSEDVTGLTNGTAYTFTVAATNVSGTSAASTPSSSVTPAGVPGAPIGVTASGGAGQATVSWTAPSNNGTAITGYTVTPYIGATAQTAHVFGTTGTSQAITGLTNGNAYTFKLQATNAVGTGPMSAASSAVTPGVAPLFTAYGPPAATGGQAYSYTFSASGSPSPTYAVASGSLPGGLSLNTTTGVLSGTPTSSGTFVISATNSAGTVSTPSITVGYSTPVAPIFTDVNPRSATNGIAYSYTFKASGFPAPTFSIQSGSLPTGLTLDATTGVISGTPSTSSSFTIQATNSAGNVQANVSIVTYAQAAPVFRAYTLPPAYTNVAYSYAFPVTGSPSPTYSVYVGSLPGGLTLNTATGVISGIPTGSAGTFTIRAINVVGSAYTTSLTLTPHAAVAPVFTDANPPAATNTVGYSYTFRASGGPTPTYSVASGALPTGLTLDANTGVLSGTPSASGTFTVTATNAAGSVTTSSITIISSAPVAPTLTLAQLPAAILSTPFTYTATADGSPAPTFSIGAGSLPAGLSLNASTGVISGTPTGSGTFTITATNTVGSATSQPLDIDPTSPVTVQIANANAPRGATTVAYSYQFTAVGNPAPTFAVTSGSLPTGLTLDTNTGILSGTPTSLGTYPFVIQATNGLTTDTANVSIAIASPVAPVFVNAAPPSAINGTAYSYTFTVVGNPESTFSVASGALPAGLSLDPATGVISGTPTANGTFTITATNGAGSATTSSITIVVNPLAAPAFVGSSTPPPAVTGSAYSFTFVATGTPAPTFSVYSGSLPTGLSLDSATGVLSGTPTTSGTFTVRAANSQGNVTTPSLTIETAAAAAPTIVAANPPAGIATLPYAYAFLATGNLPPTYTVASGSLPAGLTLDSATGVLSGTPTSAGTFTVSIANASGTVTTGSITIPLLTAAAPVLTNVAPSLVAVNGLAYSYQFTSTGAPNPTYSLASGSFPAGLTLNTTTGVLSGTPTTTASSTFTIRVINNQGNSTSAAITLNVTDSAVPAFVSATVPAATDTIPYSFAVGVNGNPLPTFSLASGTLPAGLTLDANTGIISGTPTSNGTSTFTITATNAFGSATSNPISIIASQLATPLFVTATPPNAAVVSLPYSYTFTATGTPAPTFSVASGALPAGLTLNSTTGVLSGTPTTPGVATFTINAHNSSGDLATSTLTITTGAPASPSFGSGPTPPTAATQTVPYTYTFVAPGTPAATYSLASGTLPAGLTLDPNTGVLSGTPTTPGVYTFVIAATNPFGTVTTSPITILTSAPAAPVVTPGSNPGPAIIGQPYSYTFPVSGSPAPTFSVATGLLPPGLSLDPNTGTISGTPTGPGTFTISITNAFGTVTTNTITVGAAAAAAPVFTASTPPPAYNTFAYNYTFAASGNPAPTYAIASGVLPAGLNLDPSTGIVSGMPTGSGTATFVITATNTFGSVSTSATSISTTVPVAPTLPSIPALPTAIFGIPFSYTFPYAGNPAPTFSVASGTLPAGLTLDPITGVLSGTPTQVGTTTFTVAITNASGTVNTDAITVTTMSAQTGGATAATPTGDGYWSLSPTGTLSNFGNAPNLGSMNNKPLNAPIVGLSSTTTGDGYWEAASDGGVFAFGTAGFYGSMGGKPLNKPVVAMNRTTDSDGYWLIGSDGGVFAFGDAQFYGSMGGTRLNQQIVGMSVTPSGKGYWLVGADGGVFAFGDAQFYGSLGATNLNKHIVGIAATPDGNGYWLAAADGGVFAFGNAPFFGSLGATGNVPISGILANGNDGYRLIGTDGKAYPFGTNPN